MAKLVFFIGGAGAGKTTLAKALAARRGVALLDMDTLLRPAAEAIMTLAGLDPSDRDSADYKRLCRDLGYRITMDAALENLELGIDAYVIGPFTKETEDPNWIRSELSRIGAAAGQVEVKVIVAYLADLESYRERIRRRDTVLDRWKLEHWDEFSRSLTVREPKWPLPENAVLFYDNSLPLSEEKLTALDRFLNG
ncbi:AAA family ATPase [Cohnella terricola]|uniref:ATP-binding protein n=1 Tax=Cohnella terricola TaxID=1289167 RepID=A0A559JSY4_9BACL|nr:AAA family ATPase [Cohnella terricola]TVY02993.1 ATP-binding protein [Cohnella terricola]